MAITHTYSTADVLTFSYTTLRKKYFKPEKKERKVLKFCPNLNFTLCYVWARSCCVAMFNVFLPWRNIPSRPRPLHYRGFMITLRHTKLGRTILDESSARRRDLYLTTHNTHNRQTSMPPTGFQPMIPASKWPQNHVLDHAATGIGVMLNYEYYYLNSWITVVINRTIYCDVHEHCLLPALRTCEIYVTKINSNYYYFF